MNLIDGVFILSHLTFHYKNFNIIWIFLNNGYSLKLIFSIVHNRLHKKFAQINNLDARQRKDTEKNIISLLY